MQQNQLKPKKKSKVVHADSGDNQAGRLEDRLLSLLIAYPATRHLQQTIDGSIKFTTPTKQDVYQYLLGNPQSIIDETDLPLELKDHLEYVKLALLIATESYQSFSSNERLREVVDLAKRLVRMTKMDRKNSLTAELQQAQEKGDEVAATKIIKELDVINKSLK